MCAGIVHYLSEYDRTSCVPAALEAKPLFIEAGGWHPPMRFAVSVWLVRVSFSIIEIDVGGRTSQGGSLFSKCLRTVR